MNRVVGGLARTWIVGLGAFGAVLAGLSILGYGVWGTYVVFSDWRPCVDPSATPIGDYPTGYCSTVNWPVQFGIGIGMVVVGVLAIVAARWLLRRSPLKPMPRG